MIVFAGLSPAWQQLVALDEFVAGEVLRAREVLWSSAGKVLNAAIAARHLETTPIGEPGSCRAVTVLGGLYGEAIERDLARLGLDLCAVPVDSRTRICTTLLDAKASNFTELVENQGSVRDEELARFESVFEEACRGATAVCFAGSLPHSVPVDLWARLARGLGATDASRSDSVSAGGGARPRWILDAQGEALLAALAPGPFLVKPNRRELEKTLGTSFASEEDVFRGMERLRTLGARWVVVTQGSGDVLVVGEDQRFRATPPRVEIVNAIGCGDAMAGAITWSFGRGDDALTALRYGMAAAADNIGERLMGRLDRERVEEFAAGVEFRPA